MGTEYGPLHNQWIRPVRVLPVHWRFEPGSHRNYRVAIRGDGIKCNIQRLYFV